MFTFFFAKIASNKNHESASIKVVNRNHWSILRSSSSNRKWFEFLIKCQNQMVLFFHMILLISAPEMRCFWWLSVTLNFWSIKNYYKTLLNTIVVLWIFPIFSSRWYMVLWTNQAAHCQQCTVMRWSNPKTVQLEVASSDLVMVVFLEIGRRVKPTRRSFPTTGQLPVVEYNNLCVCGNESTPN